MAPDDEQLRSCQELPGKGSRESAAAVQPGARREESLGMRFPHAGDSDLEGQGRINYDH
jgi:hypothetical protein